MSDAERMKIGVYSILTGVTTFEEITYRTGLQRKELEKILQLYNGDVSYIMLLFRVESQY